MLAHRVLRVTVNVAVSLTINTLLVILAVLLLTDSLLGSNRSKLKHKAARKSGSKIYPPTDSSRP